VTEPPRHLFPAPFMKETVFSLLYIFASFVIEAKIYHEENIVSSKMVMGKLKNHMQKN